MGPIIKGVGMQRSEGKYLDSFKVQQNKGEEEEIGTEGVSSGEIW